MSSKSHSGIHSPCKENYIYLQKCPLPGRGGGLRTEALTSIQAAGHVVALAGRALKQGRGPDDLGAGPSGLGLGAPAVPELGAQAQELLGGGFGGHQPASRGGGRQVGSVKNQIVINRRRLLKTDGH